MWDLTEIPLKSMGVFIDFIKHQLMSLLQWIELAVLYKQRNPFFPVDNNSFQCRKATAAIEELAYYLK